MPLPLPPAIYHQEEIVQQSNPSLIIQNTPSVQYTPAPIAPSIQPVTPPPPPKPNWVLVIPYTYDGKNAFWSPIDPWSQVWKAPGRSHGLRFVTNMGDYDDNKIITKDSLLNPDQHVSDFSRLGNKYGASVVVIMQKASDGINMSIIHYGSEVSQAEDLPENLDTSNISVFRQELMDDVYSIISTGNDEENTDITNESTSTISLKSSKPIIQTAYIDIEDKPELSAPGIYGTSIVMDASRPDIVEKLKNFSNNTPGFVTLNISIDQGGIELVGKWNGEKANLITLLKEKGIPVGE